VSRGFFEREQNNLKNKTKQKINMFCGGKQNIASLDCQQWQEFQLLFLIFSYHFRDSASIIKFPNPLKIFGRHFSRQPYIPRPSEMSATAHQASYNSFSLIFSIGYIVSS